MVLERVTTQLARAANRRGRRAPFLEPLERRHLMAGWSPIGPETVVNDSTAGVQETAFESHKSIASNDNGAFVVVWSGAGSGDASGIFARRYDASGALGGSFRVNTTTSGVQTEAAVAMDNAGNFIVVWSSNGQDGGGWGVYGQRYNAAGVAQGGEFRVNVTTSGNQNQPSVAADADGDFVITWTTANLDGDGTGIGGRRYNAGGVAQGGEIRVNDYTDGNQVLSRVAMDDAGNFVAVWQSDYPPTGSIGIFGQRFSAAGAAIGLWFVANTTTGGFQLAPSIGMNASGAFVVAWTSDSQDGSGNGIYAQRYTSAGAAAGGEFLVNSTTAGDQQYPSIAIDNTGAFVATWESNGQDGSGSGVYAQEYTAAGAAIGSEFRVNATTAGAQQEAAVSMVGNGDYVIAWSGNGAGDANGVFIQRFEDRAADVVVTPTSGLTTTEIGGAASFTIVLNSRPTADVTVSLSSSDATEGSVSAGSVTFTRDNWNVAQTVVVTGINDSLAEGSVPYSVVTGVAVSADADYSGRAVSDVALVNLPDPGSAGGLRASYFDNDNFTSLRLTRRDPSVNFNWAAGSPDPSIGPDTFSVRWTGELQPRYGQTYTFYTTSDDGVRLWVNGVLIIQNWTDHSVTVDAATITLAADQWYTIVMEMRESTGVAVSRLEWSSLSQTREVVPPSRLRPANAAPVAVDDGYSVVAGNTLTVNGAGVLANDADSDGDTRVAALLSGPSSGTLQFNADGSFIYTPAAGFSGTATFGYSINDGWGGSDSATVTITVTNAAPVVGTTGTALTYVENSGAVAIDQALTLSDANDSSLTGATVQILGYVAGEDVLSVTSGGGITASWSAATGTLTLSGVATVAGYQSVLRAVTYRNTSDNPNVAARSVRFVVNDGQAASAPAARTLTITAVNDAPVTAAETYTTDADTALNVGAAAGVLGNDSDVDGGPLTASLVQQAANGTVQFFADGSFTYTPNAGFYGNDSFIYAANDGAGGSANATVTLQVTLVPAPGANVTPTNGLTTSEGGGNASFTVVLTRRPTAEVRISLAMSLAGEGALAASTLVFDAFNWNVPQTVTVTGIDDGLNDGDRVYVVTLAPAVSADPLYNGLNPSDVGVSNTANGPQAPIATADSFEVVTGSNLSVSSAGVLANDLSPWGLPLTSVVLQLPANGLVSLAPDGGFVYTPAAGFVGVDRFTYAANQLMGGSAAAEVTITVRAAAPVPDPAPGPDPDPVVVPPVVVPVPPADAPVSEEPDPSDEEDDELPIVTPAPEPMWVEPVGKTLTATVRQAESAGKQQQSMGPTVAIATAPGPMPARLPQPRAAREQAGHDAGEQNDDGRDDDGGANVATRWIATPGGVLNGGVLAPPLLTAAGPLAKTLDVMARQIANTDTAHNATIRSVSQVAMAMTAGYVMWSLRGASLLASLVTSLPLWRSLDPLPILESRADKAAVARKRRRKKDRRNRIKRDDDDKLGSLVN